jgi:DNA helicase-2/ATP-dependent DNA helicase PcrA
LSPHLDSRPTTQSPQLDEERRLFYVGMTRARERLYFVRARKRMLFGQALELPASPFLSDIRVALETSLPPKLSRRKQQEREQMKLF